MAVRSKYCLLVHIAYFNEHILSVTRQRLLSRYYLIVRGLRLFIHLYFYERFWRISVRVPIYHFNVFCCPVNPKMKRRTQLKLNPPCSNFDHQYSSPANNLSASDKVPQNYIRSGISIPSNKSVCSSVFRARSTKAIREALSFSSFSASTGQS